ncbi:methyl-accepting chemotaxis protein, partial [Thermodesulfobacteriota bacterium]
GSKPGPSAGTQKTGTSPIASLKDFDEAVAKFKTGLEYRIQAAADVAAEKDRAVHLFVYLGVLIFFTLGAVFAYWVARSITSRVKQALDLAGAVGNGDLSRRLKIRTNDEIGKLGGALNNMVESLRTQTTRIQQAVNVLGSATAEISATVGELAATSARTSSAITETSTTVEQVKQAAKVSGDQAKTVSRTAQHAAKTADSGRQATEDTVRIMNQISEQMDSIGQTVVKLSDHSHAIEEIIEAVNDLADQSNLLAVNASIEAARAGEQGKSFAVVAMEIKTLADQSKGATEQIRHILRETTQGINAAVSATEAGNQAVQGGVEQSVSAGESIGVLATSVMEASNAAAMITTSTDQQFVGVDQVAGAMANIRDAMAQTVDGTAMLERATNRLEELGGSLKQLVQKYKI